MEITVRIEGRTPLLVNRFLGEGVPETEQPAYHTKNGKTAREEAEQRLHKDKSGNPALTSDAALRTLINGGRFMKKGTTKITTTKGSLLYGILRIPTLYIPIEHERWEVDIRSVVIPKTGGRIMRIRPRFDEWALTFQLDFDGEIVTLNELREIVNHASRKIGLGDFRPDRKGPFGVFDVTRWVVEK